VPTQTWTGSRYQVSPAQVLQKIAGPPIAQATPPFWSDAQTNQSGNSTSPLCHDGRDKIVAEYGTYPIRDIGFQDGKNGAVCANQDPLFTPNCFLLANANNFPAGFNSTGATTPWILVKEPLVVLASYGYGLNYWQQRLWNWGQGRLGGDRYGQGQISMRHVCQALCTRRLAVDNPREVCPLGTDRNYLVEVSEGEWNERAFVGMCRRASFHRCPPALRTR
jgi:hypothetical protein